MNAVTMTFPLSRVKQFRHDPSSGLRYGQAFHQFMELDKCTSHRDFCDRLYNAEDDVAKAVIKTHTDPDN